MLMFALLAVLICTFVQLDCLHNYADSEVCKGSEKSSISFVFWLSILLMFLFLS